MLEVEVAANCVYSWAAERLLEQQLLEQPTSPAEHARAVRMQTQELRHRFHERLMEAFLDPAVFEGRVRVEEQASAELAPAQISLLDAR